MLRFLAIVVIALVLVSCDSGTAGPTTSTSSTTTTIDNDTCDRVTEDTVSFLDSLISELDETRLAEFRNRAEWPDDLKELERAGRDLDIRVAALRCDPVAIRQQALDRANLAPGGPLSAGLIDVLLSPPTTTSTTTTTSTSTSTTTIAPGAEETTTTETSEAAAG